MSSPYGTSLGAAPNKPTPVVPVHRANVCPFGGARVRFKTTSGHLVCGLSRHAARSSSPRCQDRPTETSFPTRPPCFLVSCAH